MSYLNLGETWNGWVIEDFIGAGSYGEVYKIVKREFGHIYESALKVIRIPQSQAEVKTAYIEGMDKNSVAEYFRSMVEEIVSELELMSQLKGNSNIVSYEDHTVTPVDEGIGWTICIRMELLKPLIEKQMEAEFDVHEIIKLGIDICNALDLCEKNRIIHRDVKPENIFYSTLGFYKIGDFGIARRLENATSGMSKKGTYSYMAPEVYQGKPYGITVDVYSLGIVLYKLLNDNRLPFFPRYPETIRFSDNERANQDRFSGKKMPLPSHAENSLGEVILKACEYDPEDRYKDAEEFRAALEEEKKKLKKRRKIKRLSKQSEANKSITDHDTGLPFDPVFKMTYDDRSILSNNAVSSSEMVDEIDTKPFVNIKQDPIGTSYTVPLFRQFKNPFEEMDDEPSINIYEEPEPVTEAEFEEDNLEETSAEPLVDFFEEPIPEEIIELEEEVAEEPIPEEAVESGEEIVVEPFDEEVSETKETIIDEPETESSEEVIEESVEQPIAEPETEILDEPIEEAEVEDHLEKTSVEPIVDFFEETLPEEDITDELIIEEIAEPEEEIVEELFDEEVSETEETIIDEPEAESSEEVIEESVEEPIAEHETEILDEPIEEAEAEDYLEETVAEPIVDFDGEPIPEEIVKPEEEITVDHIPEEIAEPEEEITEEHIDEAVAKSEEAIAEAPIEEELVVPEFTVFEKTVVEPALDVIEEPTVVQTDFSEEPVPEKVFETELEIIKESESFEEPIVENETEILNETVEKRSSEPFAESVSKPLKETTPEIKKANKSKLPIVAGIVIVAIVILVLVIKMLAGNSGEKEVRDLIASLNQESFFEDEDQVNEVCAYNITKDLYFKGIRSISSEIKDINHIKQNSLAEVSEKYGFSEKDDVYSDYFEVSTDSIMKIDSVYEEKTFEADCGCSIDFLVGKKSEDEKWIIIGCVLNQTSLSEIDEDWTTAAIDILETIKTNDLNKIYDKSIMKYIVDYNLLSAVLDKEFEKTLLEYLDKWETYDKIDNDSVIGVITEPTEFIDSVKSGVDVYIEEMNNEDLPLDEALKDVLIDQINETIEDISEAKSIVFLSKTDDEFPGAGFTMVKVNDEWAMLSGFYD